MLGSTRWRGEETRPEASLGDAAGRWQQRAKQWGNCRMLISGLPASTVSLYTQLYSWAISTSVRGSEKRCAWSWKCCRSQPPVQTEAWAAWMICNSVLGFNSLLINTRIIIKKTPKHFKAHENPIRKSKKYHYGYQWYWPCLSFDSVAHEFSSQTACTTWMRFFMK